MSPFPSWVAQLTNYLEMVEEGTDDFSDFQRRELRKWEREGQYLAERLAEKQQDDGLIELRGGFRGFPR